MPWRKKKTADEKVIAIDKVNVREEPNTDSEVLGRLTVGTELYRYEAMGDGWSFVLYDGQDEYVKSEYLATESEYTAIKKAEGEQAKADDEQAAAAAQTAAAPTIASTTTAETSNAATSSGTKTNTSSGGGGGNPDIGNYYTEPATGGAYIVNATNHKVHVSSCHKLPAEGNRLYFNSLAEVQAAGYSDYCGICMR